MTPNFALDLSEDGITLLHRAPNGAGWYREGRVEFATEDIAAGLAKFRARALELEGEGFQTKLILPPSQLLFTSVDLGADVGQALSQRTPYRADQLSWDTSEDGEHLRVVAVALETLGEAEGFITPHKLNPVGFTASPKPHQFKGEPMLGGTLMGADSFETDSKAVKIIEKPNFLPSPVAPAEPEPEPVADTQPVETTAPVTAKAKVAEAPKPQPAPAKVEPEAVSPPPLAAKPEVAEKPAAPEPELQKVVDAPKQDAAKPETTKPAIPLAAVAKPTPKPSAPVAPKVDPKPVAAANAAPAAFSSRRNDEGDAPAETGKRVKRRSPRIVTRILLPEDSAKAGAAQKRLEAVAPAPAAPAAPKLTAAPAARTAPPVRTPAPAAVAAVRPAYASASAAPATPAPTPRDRTMPPAAVAEQLAKADPLAKLAAEKQRGKPRFLGLILTAILLVCLGLAAVISSFVLPDNALSRFFGIGREEVEVAIEQPPIDPELIEGLEAELSPEELARTNEIEPDEIEIARLPTEEVFPEFDDLLPQVQAPSPEPAQPAIRPEPITEDEARAAYAATGIWQYSDTLEPGTSAAENLNELYVASIDPNPVFEDAPALQQLPAGGGEVQLVAFAPPPPPGVIFDIDERGFVRPTPEGSINPFGVMIFQGPPPVAATPRPDDGTAPVPQAEQEAAEAEAADAVEVDRLSLIRPLQRPGNLVEQRERATLGGLSRVELAAVRPTQRPISPQLQAQAIARALAEADAGTPEEAEETVLAATPRAVTASLRARARPANLAATVTASRSAPQTTRPQPQPETPSAAVQSASASTASAAARGSGPAVARTSRATPTGPVGSAVARAATDNNAIALGRVSLVGVFGTASNRRALVRMPNGRFRKVSVGDRVDGGQVAAISASSLRYTKSGRTVTLNMPQS